MSIQQSVFSALCCVLLGAALPAYTADMAADVQKTASVQEADASLSKSIGVALRADSVLGAYSINVECLDGMVRLTGTVKSDSDKRYATAFVSSFAGVKSVKNDITLG
jgi:osmotically-inducible protein OsmY